MEVLITEELEASCAKSRPSAKKGLLFGIGAILLCLPILFGWFAIKETQEITLSEEEMISLAPAPFSATGGKKSIISIPQGTVKSNPFEPYRNLTTDNTSVTNVPSNILVEPPTEIDNNSEAARVMDTIVSGILFDKFSPSAILNIEGNDYLVKKGDVVNNYKVENIAQDSVTVKLGANVYKAGIGEILTEGSLNHNDVSNLSNKFGGER